MVESNIWQDAVKMTRSFDSGMLLRYFEKGVQMIESIQFCIEKASVSLKEGGA